MAINTMTIWIVTLVTGLVLATSAAVHATTTKIKTKKSKSDV